MPVNLEEYIKTLEASNKELEESAFRAYQDFKDLQDRFLSKDIRVLKNGKQFTNYVYDKETKTFSSPEDGLTIDFPEAGITFKTGDYCTFKTGDNCTFNTGSLCTFNTGDGCTFEVGKNCFGIRYDVEGIEILPENKKVKYNKQGMKGFKLSIKRKKKI